MVAGNVDPMILVTFTNLTQGEVTFSRPVVGPRQPGSYLYSQWLSIQKVGGDPVSPGTGAPFELPADTEWDENVTLGPGASFSYCLSLINWGFEEMLPVGEYTLQATYEYFDVPIQQFDDRIEQEQWMEANHQLLVSGPQTITVIEQGASAPRRPRLVLAGKGAPDATMVVLFGGRLYAARSYVASLPGVRVQSVKGMATITCKGRSVELPVGKCTAAMRARCAIPGSAGLLLPLRPVAAGLGMGLRWDPATRTARLRLPS